MHNYLSIYLIFTHVEDNLSVRFNTMIFPPADNLAFPINVGTPMLPLTFPCRFRTPFIRVVRLATFSDLLLHGHLRVSLLLIRFWISSFELPTVLIPWIWLSCNERSKSINTCMWWMIIYLILYNIKLNLINEISHRINFKFILEPNTVMSQI